MPRVAAAQEPAWDELGLPEAQHLPAVRWKVDNLAKLGAAKRFGVAGGRLHTARRRNDQVATDMLQLLEALRAVLGD